MTCHLDMRAYRKPEYPANTLFINRWSPRAMSGEAISDEELMILFEAAKWAPSSYNNQPWRFLYAKRHSPYWPVFFDLLVENNKLWAKNAAVLIVVISKNTLDRDGSPARTHSYDAGAAWQNFALQGSMLGLVVHGMQGFDYAKAREVLHVPNGYTVEAMIAVGKPGNKDELPEHLREREVPSPRKSLAEIVYEGPFKA